MDYQVFINPFLPVLLLQNLQFPSLGTVLGSKAKKIRIRVPTGSFASAMSLSTQAKLRMNFQVSLLMKNNPLYINDSNDINDSLTMTQIQKHCLSRLLVISALNNSNLSRLLSRLFQFFF
jgi:hypothetical protein